MTKINGLWYIDGTTDNNGIRNYYRTTYVDIETGEILLTGIAKNKEKYIIIKTNKNIKYYGQSKRLIEYTAQCRKQPQQRFSFD